ncbi:MAG: TIGR02453 family protein [Bacteroidales bacterium]
MNATATFDFLKELRENNTKEWFYEHTNEYDNLHFSFEKKIDELVHLLETHNRELSGLTGRDCTWHIYKNNYFLTQSSEFKTCFTAFIAKGGKKSPYCGYYIHLEPDNCYIAGSVWSPESLTLSQIRKDITERTTEFESILEDPELQRYYTDLELWDDYRDSIESVEFNNLKRLNKLSIISRVDDSLFHNNNWTTHIYNRLKVLNRFQSFINESIENNLRMRNFAF